MVRETALRIAGLRKCFGQIQVLGGIDLELRAGEITVLMGANGAGKSTLVKIMSGLYRPDGGTMSLGGRGYAPANPAEAMRAGVVTVHQNINDGVVAALDVATNLTLDRLSGSHSPIFFNIRRVRREARAVADRLGLSVDLDASITSLSLADRQMVTIARAMAHEPQVLILDEPTSSLSSAEANGLFGLMDRLRDRGVAILYISHRMSDIRRLADRIICLRDGAIAGIFEQKPLDHGRAVNAMLGQAIGNNSFDATAAGQTVFSIEGVRLKDGARPISIALGKSQIVAVTGLVGVGKTALAETLFGVRPLRSGTMMLNGRNFRPGSPGEAIDAGVFLIAKDRAENGIVGDFNVYENMSLPFLKRMSRFGISRRQAERRAARSQIEDLGIVCRSEKDSMGMLSGGNQQKVMVARWMAQQANLFILDEPFQGVDIAARHDIAAKLRANSAGRATLLFLTELDEALETADRILVMSEHTVVGEHRNSDIDMDRLMAEVAGQSIRAA
ncbi:MAG: sugar ABC transporter ATP-binding protein [Pseudaminobacter sp.]|nr:sugar ABC transporter ATP-binding protein [Pseudaminobacter sp.]